jgi:glycoprotein endo-alpha-1,2-mannosidase
MKKILLLLFFGSIFFSSAAQNAQLNYHAFCFYYNWYGSPELNGKPWHWAHPVMKKNDSDTTTGYFPGHGDIGSDYYPQLGEYSNADSTVIDQHMQQIASAGIGVIAVTWLGQEDYTFKSVPIILNAAGHYGIKVCFQIEPVVRKSALATRNAVEFIIREFGSYPAFYRNSQSKRPIFFVYDSYVITAKEWSSVFGKDGEHTIRNTPFDADMIGLWVTENEQKFFLESGFDGFYTYFASEGFTFGSTPSNWLSLQKWADENHKIFIPSVGPGYSDNRIRPWNSANTKDREKGNYYDRMFRMALRSNLKMIGITSFNEWHEGTQIEPAVPFSTGKFNYSNYDPLPPDYYLKRTKYWLEKFGDWKN